ncbi:hypothetical protein [Streptomyces sp. f150]|uniref:hypothetical protein n=1 Tax=Streptomyces sp. f150 TaxID=1827699 RepID=UPI00211D929B|nr:hypothetical protein [Streptomyces sp. f150]
MRVTSCGARPATAMGTASRAAATAAAVSRTGGPGGIEPRRRPPRTRRSQAVSSGVTASSIAWPTGWSRPASSTRRLRSTAAMSRRE